MACDTHEVETSGGMAIASQELAPTLHCCEQAATAVAVAAVAMDRGGGMANASPELAPTQSLHPPYLCRTESQPPQAPQPP